MTERAEKLEYLKRCIRPKYEAGGVPNEQLDEDMCAILDCYYAGGGRGHREACVEALGGCLHIATSKGGVTSAGHLYDRQDEWTARWIDITGLDTVAEGVYARTIEQHGRERFYEFLYGMGMHRQLEVVEFTNQNASGKPSCAERRSTGVNFAMDKRLPGLPAMLATIAAQTDDALAKELWNYLAALPQGWHTALHTWYDRQVRENECQSEIVEQLQGAAWLLGGKRPSEVTRAQLVAAGYTPISWLMGVLGVKE